MFYLSGKVKKLDLISAVLVVGFIVISWVLIRNYYESQISYLKSEASLYRMTLDRLKAKISVPRYPFATDYDRKDYHDYEFMELEALREGPGEQGEKLILTDPDEIQQNKEVYKKFGVFGLVSDKISVNRSLPDLRLPSCKSKQHLKELPKVSIVIVFFDEYWSVLLRTLHSIYNRTPHELLEEIILINDNSSSVELYEPLRVYVERNFHGLVKIHNMNERRGLTVGRLEGARLSSGQVLVFLDSQVEVNVNWLPPLLEPIALTPRIITTPIVDNFAYDTFEYRKIDDGGRGIFNWNLHFRRFPRRPQDSLILDAPIPNPVMVGSAFAINRQNFWDLGSYDDGLKVWQGEQLELSFKAHLCGGGMVEVPCSRIAHSYRYKNTYSRFGDDGQDYMIRNFKRIAEVWLDEYKGLVYAGNKRKYAEADAGDLVRAKSVRRGLHCKPFRYFLEFVAPEILTRYPLEDPGCFAKGAIQSKANPNLCIEVPKAGNVRRLILNECDKNFVQPSPKQFLKLSWHRNIQHSSFDYCLTDALRMAECHYLGRNQFWKFDIQTLQISQPSANGTRCITADIESLNVSLSPCDLQNSNQKWNWGEKNISALNDWESFGVKLKESS